MNLHRLDLVSLSLFALIVRSGSISKGAELAHLATGAASKRIADLESAIGAELFERHSRGITLTVAGEALKLHAQRILSDVDLMTADMSDYAAGVVGVLALMIALVVVSIVVVAVWGIEPAKRRLEDLETAKGDTGGTPIPASSR